MKVAIMQPYFLPYIGYFQLINAVDTFVMYDDVNFINRGWINRNNFLVNNQKYMFTVPLKEASQNKLIKDIKIDYTQKWVEKFLKTIEQTYKKAPYFHEIFTLLTNIFVRKHDNIASLNLESIQKICEYLNINVSIVTTSQIYANTHLKGQERILDICLKEKATDYINAIGGLELYNKDIFQNKRINLSFIVPNIINYQQFDSFISGLSIVDVLMFKGTETKIYLENIKLL